MEVVDVDVVRCDCVAMVVGLLIFAWDYLVVVGGLYRWTGTWLLAMVDW